MDFWNPNTWDLTPKPRFLYLDDRAEQAVLLDEEDYFWAVQWRWHINAPHKTRKGRKRYAVRTQGGGGRYKPKLYLHVEVMRRTGITPPSEHHKIVDHRDGNEFDCRRVNLRWATPTMNRNNLFGALASDLLDSLV